MSDMNFNPEPQRRRPLDKVFTVWPWAALTVLVAVLLMMAGDAININSHLMPVKAKADAVSDKYDGDCTGHETDGRCADKCPAPTDQGAYFLRGFDKDTGAAVCGFSWYHACPYTEAVSADDPMCYKNQPAAQQPETTPVTTTPNTSDDSLCGVAK